jgi:hypothetical protein
MTATPGADGALHITVPVGTTTGRFDVSIVVKPQNGPTGVNGWPDGYFEQTYGSIADESFVAPPRPLPESVEPLG